MKIVFRIDIFQSFSELSKPLEGFAIVIQDPAKKNNIKTHIIKVFCDFYQILLEQPQK